MHALSEIGVTVHPAHVRERTWGGEAWRAARAAFHCDPYVLYRRHDRPEVRRGLRQLLARETFNVIYLDHLDSFVFRTMLPPWPVVLDLHNVYSELVRRAASEQRCLLRRLYLEREAHLLKRMERAAVQGSDLVFAVSDEDSQELQAYGPQMLHVVPNAVDVSRYGYLPLGRCDAAPLMLYVGALSWGPNEEAARCLVNRVLPAVRAVIPGARVRIVGRSPSKEVIGLSKIPGVEVIADAPDLTPHLRDARVLCVPLAAGGGTRLKILEAFAAGLPVISTPIGCEGLAVADGEHLRIAEDGRIARAAAELLSDREGGAAMAGRARRLTMDRYDWDRVGSDACRAVARLVGKVASRT